MISPSASPSTTAGAKAISRLRVKRSAVAVALEQPDQHVAKGAPVEHDDGEDRAGLDGDVEQRPFVGLEAEQFGGEDEVAGRGHRQIFGQSLDHAEDDDQQQDRHDRRLAFEGSGGGARREPPALDEAAEPVGRDRAERGRRDPERLEPAGVLGGDIVALEHRHWSRVSGAPGRKPSLAIPPATKSGTSTSSGEWPAIAAIRALSSRIVITSGPAIS